MYRTMFREITVLLFFILDYALSVKYCKVPSEGALSGKCTLVNKCAPLFELHKRKSKTPDEDLFFRQSVGSCGSRGTLIKVCCPPKSQWSKIVLQPVIYPAPSVYSTLTKDVSPVNSPWPRIQDLDPMMYKEPPDSDETRSNTWFTIWQENQLENPCGINVKSGDRIVGGNATEIHEYAWLALLEYAPKEFQCGGSLITRTHVLTAAHCLRTTPTWVRLSEYNLTSEPTDVVKMNGGGTENITVVIVEVESTVVHPGYKFNSFINDIGLVKMNQAIIYGDFIKPICMPTVDYRNTFFTIGTKFTVAGWGYDGNLKNSEVKRFVYVPYVTMDECQALNYTKQPTDEHICAGGENGKDSCRGDSGGPLMYEDTSSIPSRFIVVGIVSYGKSRCGTEGHPAYYTYVHRYLDWITEMVNVTKNV